MFPKLERAVSKVFLHFFIDSLFSVPWWVRQRVPETEPLPESLRCPFPDNYIASYRILPGWFLRIPVLQPFAAMHEKVQTDADILCVPGQVGGRVLRQSLRSWCHAVVKEAGKTDRKTAQQKQTVDGKDKKLSIHERLEINKKIIQEKQGKDKPERGADFGVR